MKKIIFALFVIFTFTLNLLAQPPKVIVLIILDQFPYDYIKRFQPYFLEDGGFNYLIKHGANFINAKYEHAFTKTAPGHAAIATGTYSSTNGIIANGWYDRATQQLIGCVDDDSARIIGNNQKGRSPNKLLVLTLGDLLRHSSNFRSKVISISFKDKVAILTAGKQGTAYWVEDSLVVTSTYYMQKLPRYLDLFNKSKIINHYFEKKWTETNPFAAESVCDIDDAPYEGDFGNIGKTFPHLIVGKSDTSIKLPYYNAMQHSPYATDFLLSLAKTIVIEESLGRRDAIDMLTIGISATDEIGHAFGPNSHETFDNILKTDRMLGDFFSFLENQIGLANCLIVLTSDHGIAPIPEYFRKNSPSSTAVRVKSREIMKFAERVLKSKLGNPSGKTWIEQIAESDIYLNRDAINQYHISPDSAMRVLKDSLLSLPFIAEVVTRDEIQNKRFSTALGEKVKKTFHPKRSGDVIYLLKPNNIMSGDSVGTNHGQPYDYDSHVPLIFYGKMFRCGTYMVPAQPIDLAPTIAAVLGIEFPQRQEGKVLKETLMLFKDTKNR